MIRKLALCLVMMLLLSFSAEAKVLYVDGTRGDDSVTYANNSSQSPWRTIGRAAWGSTSRANPNASQAAQAGDTVHVMAGTYAAPGTNSRYNPLYSPVNSGTSSSPIVFEAVGLVTLQLSSGSGPLLGVSAYDNQIPGRKSYVAFRGFTVYEVNAPGVIDTGVAIIAQGTGNRIENCVFVGNVNSPIANNHSGIWLTGDDNTVVRNNKISNFLNAGGYHHNAPGIMTYETRSAVIENNEISNCGAGVFIKGWDNDSNTIRYNYVHGCGGGIILSTALGTHKVYQNIIRDSHGGGAGISLHPMTNNGLRGTAYLANNTLVNAYLRLNWALGSTIQVHSHNNIVAYSGSTGYGVEAAFWDAIGQLAFDRNLYHNVSEWYSYNNLRQASIAAWRTALGGCPNTGNDCSSITSNPLFVNAGAFNFRLQSGSPARTLGRTITEIHGSSGVIIPAGAYITGSEMIGITEPQVFTPAAPRGLRVVE